MNVQKNGENYSMMMKKQKFVFKRPIQLILTFHDNIRHKVKSIALLMPFAFIYSYSQTAEALNELKQKELEADKKLSLKILLKN